MRTVVMILFCLLMICRDADTATAGIIYDSGPDEGNPIFRLPSDTNHGRFGQQAAGRFSLRPGANTITEVLWSGSYNFFTVRIDRFRIQFFEDAGGRPASSPFVDLAVGSAGRRPGTVRYTYEEEISPLTLNPDTDYWISIFNSTRIDSLGRGWFWDRYANSREYATRSIIELDWFVSATGNPSFQLAGDNLSPPVPEPTSLAIFALGALPLAGIRRRRATR